MPNLLIVLRMCFTCSSFTCYPKKEHKQYPKSITLRLRRICDSDKKFDMCSDEYQNYQLARDYNISLVKKHFHSIGSISRSEARQVKRKVTKETFNVVTVYNHILSNLQKIINNNLPLLYSDPDMSAVFPEGSINVTYRRRKILKTLISPSLFTTKWQSMVSNCGKKCDICNIFLVCRNEFTCNVTSM